LRVGDAVAPDAAVDDRREPLEQRLARRIVARAGHRIADRRLEIGVGRLHHAIERRAFLCRGGARSGDQQQRRARQQ